jgi:hypothetical protein
MPVVYHSTQMSVACGKDATLSGLDGQLIRAKELEQIATK